MHKKVGILYFTEYKSPKPYNQDLVPLSIIENTKQKGRHGNRNHCLGKRNKEGKPNETDTQKEILIPNAGKIQSRFTEWG